MKKSPRRIVGAVMLASASLASLGNWLWLVGVLPRPEDGLMEARWVYAAIVAMIAAPMCLMPDEFFR